MEVRKLSSTSTSSPSAATLNKRDQHQLAERAPLLQREQEVHQHRDCHTIVMNVSATFVYIVFKEPPPHRRHEQELLLFGQRHEGASAISCP
jgi:hypothetical protein